MVIYELKKLAPLAVLVTATVLAGCGHKPIHTCGISDGVSCLSTRQVYEHAQRGELPSQLKRKDGGLSGYSTGSGRPIEGGVTRRPELIPASLNRGGTRNVATSIFVPERPLRIWINNWVDEEGDLHESTYVYTTYGQSHWRFGGKAR